MELLGDVVLFEIVIVSLHDRCTICVKRTIGSKIILEVLLRDEAQMEARFGPFGDSANLDLRQVHGLHRTYCWLRNKFGHTQWNS
jgi:hypothetical protein